MKKYKIIMAFLLCLWGISISSFATNLTTIDEIIQKLPKEWGECDLTNACFSNGLIGADEMYVNLDSNLDDNGVNHLTFQLHHSGIPVEDGIFKIHTQNDRLKAITGLVTGGISLNSDFYEPYENLEEKALTYWNQYNSNGNLTRQMSSKQVILPVEIDGKKVYTKTIEFKIYLPQFLLHESIFVSVNNGDILEVRNHIRAADEPCSGLTRFNGEQDFSAVYQM